MSVYLDVLARLDERTASDAAAKVRKMFGTAGDGAGMQLTQQQSGWGTR